MNGQSRSFGNSLMLALIGLFVACLVGPCRRTNTDWLSTSTAVADQPTLTLSMTPTGDQFESPFTTRAVDDRFLSPLATLTPGSAFVPPLSTPTSRPPTATQTPTSFPTPTDTWTPTPIPTIDPEIHQVCGIDQVSPRQQDDQMIYFRTVIGDWYHTADQFTTTEWFAPAGRLSPDVKTLVGFGCDGPGSICVASPPQSTPVILPFRYEPAQSSGGYGHWLPDNQRLIFMADYTLPGEGTIDRQFYLLDLRTPQLHLIASMPMPDWVVSPLGTCIAYTTWDDDDTVRFHLTNVETDTWSDWIAPKGDLSREWPGWAQRMAWSPDGSRLAFTKTPKSIIVWDLVADRYERYSTGGVPVNLKWSPDGRKLYFIATGSKGGSFHWILDLATNNIRELGESRCSLGPNAYLWLPNGNEIIVPSCFSGSLLLDTTNGSTEELNHPGSEDGWSIDEMFFGPVPQ